MYKQKRPNNSSSVTLIMYTCSSRSPQWLRSKWWTLKRRIPDYQTLPFNELLANLSIMTTSGVRRVKSSQDNEGSGVFTVNPKCMSGLPLRLAPTIQLPDGK